MDAKRLCGLKTVLVTILKGDDNQFLDGIAILEKKIDLYMLHRHN